jgi:hypothetical protein
MRRELQEPLVRIGNDSDDSDERPVERCEKPEHHFIMLPLLEIPLLHPQKEEVEWPVDDPEDEGEDCSDVDHS